MSATRRMVTFVDERTRAAPLVRRALRYVFPDHWSFLLGEVALYSFLVLLGTGVYLAFFFDDSTAQTVYNGEYAPLVGHEMSAAYRSVLDLSVSVKAGLLVRQTHHWAANVFIAAIVLHLARILFTGAFRKPRDLTYYIGVTMLVLALLEGYLGYSLVDDLLSGMGLAIGYSVAMSIPFIGANVAALIWGGPFPGDPAFWSRMYVTHILLIPAALALLIGLHLILVASRHHTQFRVTPRHTERTVVGIPMVPGYAPRSLGLACAVVAVLFLLGGLVQINPIWLWGPYHVADATNGAQPDWYLGWLIGGLRLMPGWDLVIGGYTVVPNPFWGGVLFPLVVFAILFAWPSLERRLTGDYGFHNLLDRPRDAPWRTGLAAALAAWVVLVFLAGSMDRADVTLGLSYEKQLWAYRVLVWVVPVAVLFVTLRICRELRAGEDVLRRRRTAERAARLDV
ncbi:MAG TPA: cytochrome b N-terminal domain-containing protein [Gaiellaceae bacterium]|jgi:ubiquinol-cytochrome c reductase cytochrome b subunit|nr:cytochrome b N-terminal domain-containing protein [Gaiellaceae bacterium]